MGLHLVTGEINTVFSSVRSSKRDMEDLITEAMALTLLKAYVIKE